MSKLSTSDLEHLTLSQAIEWNIGFIFRRDGTSHYVCTIRRDFIKQWGDGKTYRHPVPQYVGKDENMGKAIRKSVDLFLAALEKRRQKYNVAQI
jgi:hypothetical protein